MSNYSTALVKNTIFLQSRYYTNIKLMNYQENRTKRNKLMVKKLVLLLSDNNTKINGINTMPKKIYHFRQTLTVL